MLGNIIGFLFMIGILIFAFSMLSKGLDDMEAGCIGENVTTTGCELINGDSLSSFVLKNKIIIFIIMAIPLWILFGKRMFRDLLCGISDLFESFEEGVSYEEDDKKEKHLKRMKSKLKKELNRTPDTKPKEISGVEWGSGVELGNGMDTYENKLKGGDEKKDG